MLEKLEGKSKMSISNSSGTIIFEYSIEPSRHMQEPSWNSSDLSCSLTSGISFCSLLMLRIPPISLTLGLVISSVAFPETVPTVSFLPQSLSCSFSCLYISSWHLHFAEIINIYFFVFQVSPPQSCKNFSLFYLYQSIQHLPLTNTHLLNKYIVESVFCVKEI